MSGLRSPAISAKRVAQYNLAGWIGIQDTPEELTQWLSAIGEELDKLGGSHSVDDMEISSMCWFVITDEPTDQARNGKLTNLLAGTAEQITQNLIELKAAGMTMPLIWPPFADVPVSKTLDDLRQLNDEILPQVNAA